MFEIICYVAVCFYDPKTDREIFNISKEMIGKVITAPKNIQLDPMYGLLVTDGSIRMVKDLDMIEFENDPLKDITAEGKSVAAAALSGLEEESESAEEPEEEKAKEEVQVEEKKEKKYTKTSKTK